MVAPTHPRTGNPPAGATLVPDLCPCTGDPLTAPWRVARRCGRGPTAPGPRGGSDDVAIPVPNAGRLLARLRRDSGTRGGGVRAPASRRRGCRRRSQGSSRPSDRSESARDKWEASGSGRAELRGAEGGRDGGAVRFPTANPIATRRQDGNRRWQEGGVECAGRADPLRPAHPTPIAETGTGPCHRRARSSSGTPAYVSPQEHCIIVTLSLRGSLDASERID
jgi:hypothetical protein